MSVPLQLETSRLLLRQLVHEDWPSLHEHYSDPECTRFTFGRALSAGESWRAMASMVGHWQLRGYGPYALALKSSPAVVGVCGLWFPGDWPEPEIKWALRRGYWGKGYAAEAARAVQLMAASHFTNEPPISFIDARNSASINLALAVGATLEKEVEFRGSRWHVYRHPRQERR